MKFLLVVLAGLPRKMYNFISTVKYRSVCTIFEKKPFLRCSDRFVSAACLRQDKDIYGENAAVNLNVGVCERVCVYRDKDREHCFLVFESMIGLFYPLVPSLSFFCLLDWRSFYTVDQG